MSEENTGHDERVDATNAIDLPEDELQYDAEHRDWVLQAFVGMCNMTGIEMPVTLNLQGTYLSGYIVKPEVYFDGLIADLQTARFHGDSGDAVKKMLEEMMSNMKGLAKPAVDPTEVPGSDARSMRPRYIHLRAARFFAPNDVGHPVPTLPRGTWWRGKIESVNGFYVGMPFPT
jgi:hypothetical protein